MSAQVLDGKAAAAQVLEETRERVAALNDSGKTTTLATVLVGDDPASAAYVRSKRRRAAEVGIRSVHHQLGVDSSQEQVVGLIGELNEDSGVDGILLQLPLPKGLDDQGATLTIDPSKDVDGLHPFNLGMIVLDRPGFAPCTPSGCLRILEHYQVPLSGANVVVVGRSFLVGRPLALLMASRGIDATVTIAHSRTADLAEVTRRADVLVVAVGRPEMVTDQHVRAGAVVIDVGINRTESGSLVGDVHYESVSKVAQAITPVPGGVGPMTVAMLMSNTARASEITLY
ncbi:MAG: bifunctional methylenetetrahydrofolate dehydrogenase/methenyltetrahydrofolate cyclohydrolase FolD [bacterium]|nr:bifunctional methylenetetrahydrofolate dehydrogenase/methenyltetrahydrofolate cyclohydrolase FolD [bacterium]